MRTAITIAVVWLLSATAGWAQNCVISGGVNNGTITQNCTVVGRMKLTFEPAIADELASKLPSGVPVTVIGVGSEGDAQVALQYLQFLKGKGFQVDFGRIGVMAPPPDHPISIQGTRDRTTVMIAPSA